MPLSQLPDILVKNKKIQFRADIIVTTAVASKKLNLLSIKMIIKFQ
jgi:hypothetical protein